MSNLSKYNIPLSKEIIIGELKLGGSNPLVLQSMTSTDTNDINASVQQCKRIIDNGGAMIRLTTQGIKEVESIKKIIAELKQDHKHIPIVADVHFSTTVAELAATICHKIRINPGNYTEKSLKEKEYSDEDFQEGENLNKEALRSLLTRCKKRSTALRIGVNHGSLSKRIISKYGNSPLGMVESALEFLRICKEENFKNVVISLKSSNTRVMVQSVRLMVREMVKENLYFPLHLGVTEAGDGMEGRIKSVVGMAPLLLEGIGDTIRVSLTEPSEDEIPVAISIRELFPLPTQLPYNPLAFSSWDPFLYKKPKTKNVNGIGGSTHPVVWGDEKCKSEKFFPDNFICKKNEEYFIEINGEKRQIQKISSNKQLSVIRENQILIDISIDPAQLNSIEQDLILILDMGNSFVSDIKYWFQKYYSKKNVNPVILHKAYDETDKIRFALLAAGEMGSLLIDGLIDGIWIENHKTDPAYITEVVFSTLQASRARISSTEFIACPSCGRTLFDIQTVLGNVRIATSHLTGLKIAVMGCIVNGPGEMADADYGYVGAGKGKVSLYKAGEIELKNIPAASAVDELVDLIKKYGDWVDAKPDPKKR